MSKILNNLDRYDEYHKRIRERKLSEPLNIGLAKLRDELSAVLSCGGLIIMGGKPGAGKTALVMQMMNAIAENNKRNVLVLSFEMGADELMSRDISRMMYRLNPRTARNSKELLNGYEYKNGIKVELTTEQQSDITKAEAIYAERIAKYIYIDEISESYTAETVRATIENFISEHSNEKPPVIVIDYLQLIQHEKWQDEQTAAAATAMMLKRLSRKYNVPIFALSSVPRSAYKDEASGADDLAFAKNSGNYEYSCDVAIKIKITESALGDIELSIPKNRGGESGKKINIEYNKPYNYFEETMPSIRK